MAFFTSDQLTALSSTRPRVDFLVELQFASGTMYLWNGNTDLEVGGHTWLGLKGTAKIDGLNLTQNQQSQAVTLTLSGISDIGILAKALEETPDVNQQTAIIYLQFFDEDFQIIGSPLGIYWGFMQPPKIDRMAMQDGQGAVQSIRVSVENAFFNRSRPPQGRYTDRDQQARYPGDDFFEFVQDLQNKTFVYPSY